MVAESGSLESQLEAIKLKSKEVKDKKVMISEVIKINLDGFMSSLIVFKVGHFKNFVIILQDAMKQIENLGASLEKALILDNIYTEHSTVGLAQQWDQLEQLGMRMQHNLEQQIQAR